MKLLIYADPHWSTYSSIVRSRGEKYSTRLENLINTMNWIESEAMSKSCDVVVCLGDFFDRSELTSEEITALQEVMWSDLPHWFIVGNHEMGRGNLEHSSSHLFQLLPNSSVIDSLSSFNTDDTTFIMLPYILENNRKSLKEYLEPTLLRDNVIILSHNDISGIQMGQFISTTGFSVDEISNNCKLFINGHLHNETEIGNIINLGNITGQNFSEDATKYGHSALLLDTVNKTIEKISNPYALKFYKLDFTDCAEEVIQTTFSTLTYPSVVTVKCTETNHNLIKDFLSDNNAIVESRCIVEGTRTLVEESIIEESSSIDHILKFQKFVMENIGINELIQNELERVSN